MKLGIRVDIGEGATELIVSPYAIIGWEKEHNTKVSRLVADGIGFSDLAELSWRQLRLENRYSGDLDSFEKRLEVVEPYEVENPTRD